MAEIIEIYVDGKPIWDKKDKSSALLSVPMVGAKINYQKFRTNASMPAGGKVILEVVQIEYNTEEFWNSTYAYRSIIVHCKIVNT